MERAAAVARRRQRWWRHIDGSSGDGTEKAMHVEGGQTVWAVHQHGQAAVGAMMH